jgi:hypothetical protein
MVMYQGDLQVWQLLLHDQTDVQAESRKCWRTVRKIWEGFIGYGWIPSCQNALTSRALHCTISFHDCTGGRVCLSHRSISNSTSKIGLRRTWPFVSALNPRPQEKRAGGEAGARWPISCGYFR